MKKLVILAASFALVAGACGKKDKVEGAGDAVAEKVEVATDAATEKAMDAKDSAKSYGSGEKEAAKEATESYGSGKKESMAGKLSDGDRDAMLTSCMAEGQSKEICGCNIKVVEGGLSEETLAVLVKSSKIAEADGEAAGEKYMTENMSQAQGVELFGIMPQLMECDPSMADKMQQ